MTNIAIGVFIIAFSLCISVLMYSVDGETYINGEYVPQEELNDMFFPKLIIIIFVIVGAYILFTGIMQVVKNHRTKRMGIETYGIIMALQPSNVRINGRNVWNVVVQIVQDGCRLVQYTEELGTFVGNYQPGTFVRVCYYRDDVNLIGIANQKEIPSNYVNMLKKCFEAQYQPVNSNPFPYLDDEEPILKW